ncbi:hypothetical protein BKA58DRAFT_96699 [Alternaria rosae]|uniref:uncharacterized protein n=1 Tax=Alternaria rosae TaxID=1187941 RepID=UPI001E8E5529|nr:uncharacterized protein BKA58DRAFT_96699 [Alternaria rosae]KAH6878489.1 hypothetical protein BKA58DRAFT_96699 [Alternaria rosae]
MENPSAESRYEASAAKDGFLTMGRWQTDLKRSQRTAIPPASNTSISPRTQLSATSPDGHASSMVATQHHTPRPFDRTGQVAPPGTSREFTTVLWEDEGCLCHQVEAAGVVVARREDNHMINGTKLLNVAGMTRGRRDGLLKSEKSRHVVKIGPMHLKGVWITFERALELANQEHITDRLHPLFVRDIGSLIHQPSYQTLDKRFDSQLQPQKGENATGSSKASLVHSHVPKDTDKDSQTLASDTVQDTEPHKQGLLGSLFRSLTETLGRILNEAGNEPSMAGHYGVLESTCATLFFWGTDLGLPRGELDDVLQGSPQLRDTCLAVLVSISRFVSTSLIHLVMSEHRRKEILQSTHLATLLEQVADMIGRQHDFAYQPEQDAETMCQTLRTKIDTLIMLAPSLESPAEEIFDEEKPRTIQHIEEHLPEQAYASSISEKFPLAPPEMVAQLGKLNWDRYNHILRLQRAATQQELQTTTLEKAKTIFHDSGLGTSVPAQSEVGLNTDPVYEPSIMSSRAEASHKRVPSLPAQARSGEPFTCEICEKQVQFQRTKAWKKHVFDDILAYACFFAECHDTRIFFENGEELMNHLEDHHGMDVRVSDIACPMCVEFTSRDRDILSLHIARHMEEIALAILPSGVDSDEESTGGSIDRSNARSDEDDMSSPKAGGSDNGSFSGPSVINIITRDPKLAGMMDFEQSLYRFDRHQQNRTGAQWITFEYSHDGVATEYTIRHEIETVDVERLPHEFKIDNCIFPHALVPNDQYKGGDLKNEKDWNALGWALAELNPSLRACRGLLQKAVQEGIGPSKPGASHPGGIQKQGNVPTSSAESSRRKRSCNACRKTKSRCITHEGDIKCGLCNLHKQDCTLVSEEPEPGPTKHSRSASPATSPVPMPREIVKFDVNASLGLQLEFHQFNDVSDCN